MALRLKQAVRGDRDRELLQPLGRAGFADIAVLRMSAVLGHPLVESPS